MLFTYFGTFCVSLNSELKSKLQMKTQLRTRSVTILDSWRNSCCNAQYYSFSTAKTPKHLRIRIRKQT